MVPLGSEVESEQQPQTIASVQVYPGADGSPTLFEDYGNTYAYEKSGGSVTKLTWDDSVHQLKHEESHGWSRRGSSVVTVIDK